MDAVSRWFSLQQPESDRRLGLETASEYRKRWISIRVIYFTGFVAYLAFTIVAPVLWPYLRALDPEAGKHFLAYLFAMPSVAQLVLSPMVGYWNNKTTSIRTSMVLFLVLFIAGWVIYAVVEEFESHRKYVMLVSRALTGASSVVCTIYRGYLSAATTVRERTKTMSYMSLAQTLGILAGSMVQPVFSALGEEGFFVFGAFRVNMYSAVGWLCAVVGVINVVLMMPCIFRDFNIAVKEAMSGQGSNVRTVEDVLQSMDVKYLAVGLMLVAFSLEMMYYSAMQT